MTVPYERKSAVNRTRKFLYDLMDPKATPRVPKDIRLQARSLLRHYPSDFDMEMACENEAKANTIFKVFSKDFWS